MWAKNICICTFSEYIFYFPLVVTKNKTKVGETSTSGHGDEESADKDMKGE